MRSHESEIIFEESLSDDWSGDLEVREVALNDKPLVYVGGAILAIALVVVGRILYLGVGQANAYTVRAEANLGTYTLEPAPRGEIVDRTGTVIADNKPVFSAYLDVAQFLHDKNSQTATLAAIESVLGIPQADVESLVAATDLDHTDQPILLDVELDQRELVAFKEDNLPAIIVKDGFKRDYPEGRVYSSLVGYIGLPTANDLKKNPDLGGDDVIGKAGLEAYYDSTLRGLPGVKVKIADAKGNELTEQEKAPPEIGQTLTLSIDGEFQKYFYDRMTQGLAFLGRTSGVAIAMNPQNGQVLALANFPSYDNNVFTTSGHGDERKSLLTDPAHPLFNRAIGGLYSPGSTIKPLVGLAALVENIISPTKTIFSPGYIDVANPYDPAKPTRYLDWRYQGDVDMHSALAQSSDVYFYEVGGGAPGQKGLGINQLDVWWQKFRLDQQTGIDLPHENSGFLPTIDWKEKATGRPWLLGDTYNVSIGQGDLQITPIELLDYISAIANGGKLYQPTVTLGHDATTTADFTQYPSEMKDIQQGMVQTVVSPQGTAYALHDLPFPSAAKTGSAQIHNNQSENAFFVGYAPVQNPQIAILVLVEQSKEGSLNAVPIARDVLNWYYEHRLTGNNSTSTAP